MESVEKVAARVLNCLKNICGKIKQGYAPDLKITTKQYLRVKWHEIEKLSEKDLKAAIIKADELLDFTLDQLGYRGKNTVEKIESAKNKFDNYPQLLEARKMRNRLINDEELHLSQNELTKIFTNYQLAFEKIADFNYRR